MKAPFAALILMMTSCCMSASNLLLNADFAFEAFEPSRPGGGSNSGKSGAVPFWDQQAYGDLTVVRGPAAPFRPVAPVEAVVTLAPGKSVSQRVILSEVGLDPGAVVSLSVHGFQKSGGALEVTLHAVQVDSESGQWNPADFGQSRKEAFPKAARGEAALLPIGKGVSGAQPGAFLVELPKLLIPGLIPGSPEAAAEGRRGMTFALEVVFTNPSNAEVSIYAPSLVAGAQTVPLARSSRPLPQEYRSLPRTVARLRAGVPLHFIVMGSSIDRASANPAFYHYDEDPNSPTYKQPISAPSLLFDGELVGAPELTPYYGWWAHYYGYGGRLKRRLMEQFNYPVDRLLINYMACDGSSIGEAHSALQAWSSLALPPNPDLNGTQGPGSWQELYPALFERPEGPRPDLVIFGSGANEKIDGAKEVAAFEGAIRWFQRHYPDVEFVIAMWNTNENYTRNASMMKDLALRYGIPVLDVGRHLHLITRHVPTETLTPKDGHPQAAAHDLWGRLLERAFLPTDPAQAGFAQRHLPERHDQQTIGWEGETLAYAADSPRIHAGQAFILDDTWGNLWAAAPTGVAAVEVFVNGQPSTTPSLGSGSRLTPFATRNPRNSTFAIGNLNLGERHLIEVKAPATVAAFDSKAALQRRWHPITSPGWEGKTGTPTPFASRFGAPYGSEQLLLTPGAKVRLRWVGTLASVAWAHQTGGGTLVVSIDGSEQIRRSTAETFQAVSGESLYLEDRAAHPPLPFGVHELEVSAEGGPVALLGAFTYDTRANTAQERTLTGLAAPGESFTFSTAFRATPVVNVDGGLKVREVSPTAISFEGAQPGSYRITGE